MERQGVFHQILHESAHGGIPSVAHDDYLVKFQALDGAGLEFHDLGELFGNQEAGSGVGRACRLYDLLEAAGLAFQYGFNGGGFTAAHHFHAFPFRLFLQKGGLGFAFRQLPDGFRFRPALDEQGLRLAFLFQLEHFRRGLGLHFALALFNAGRHQDVGLLRGAFAFGALYFRFLFRLVGFFQGLGFLHLLGHFRQLLGLRLLHLQLGGGFRNLDLGFVLALNGNGAGVRHLDGLVLFRFRLADFPAARFFRHLDGGVIDGARGCFLAQGADVAGGVLNVRDIGVNEVEAHLVQLHVHAFRNALDEFFAVGVDFLNGHGGDHHAHLAHDDFRSQVADFLPGAAQQARGGVLHDFRQGGDAHDEGGGDVHADVLGGEGALEGHVNVDGVQVQVAVGLEDRKHEGGTAVVAFGGLARAHLAEDDEDFVRRAHAVAAEQPGGRQDDEENQNGDRDDLVHGIGWGVWLGLLVNEEV